MQSFMIRNNTQRLIALAGKRILPGQCEPFQEADLEPFKGSKVLESHFEAGRLQFLRPEAAKPVLPPEPVQVSKPNTHKPGEAPGMAIRVEDSKALSQFLQGDAPPPALTPAAPVSEPATPVTPAVVLTTVAATDPNANPAQ